MRIEADDAGVYVSRLLAGAADAITAVRFCWLLTAAGASWHARPMGRLQQDLAADDWRIRFVANGRSRKVPEVHGSDRVTTIFQQGDDAFVALTGVPSVHQDPAAAQRLLKKSFDLYFPTEADRADAVVIEIDTRELDLWIRGVTPEPFGLHPSRLERGAAGTWRLTSSDA